MSRASNQETRSRTAGTIWGLWGAGTRPTRRRARGSKSGGLRCWRGHGLLRRDQPLQIGAGVLDFRIGLQGRAVLGDGLLPLALALEHDAEVIVGGGVVLVDRGSAA